jgi:DNA-binding transcriptional ArsR family regulator
VSESDRSSGFDRSRAELFEALGHPVRIRILHTLAVEPMGFSELKRSLGIESSGHLQFHLGRLDGLVRLLPDGRYTLTDDGREALLVVGKPETMGQASPESGQWERRLLSDHNIRVGNLVASALLIALGSFLVIFGGSAYYCVPGYSAPSCSQTFYFVNPFQIPEFTFMRYYQNYTLNAVGLVMLCAGSLSLFRERKTANSKTPTARRAFRNTCVAVGALSILANVATIPHAYLGILGSPSSGVSFAALLSPFLLPILNIIGMVLGLASITSAFSSEREASVLASVASGLALTFLTSWGSFTFDHYDVGWPLAWAHQFTSLGGLASLPMFYLDVAGLVFDLAFWAIAMGIALGLLRLYLRGRAAPV